MISRLMLMLGYIVEHMGRYIYNHYQWIIIIFLFIKLCISQTNSPYLRLNALFLYVYIDVLLNLLLVNVLSHGLHFAWISSICSAHTTSSPLWYSMAVRSQARKSPTPPVARSASRSLSFVSLHFVILSWSHSDRVVFIPYIYINM